MSNSETLTLLPAERPRTGTVLLWFSVAALVVSYLAAYALFNALVAADLISRWSPLRDPRPKLMLTIFSTLTGTGFVAATITRCLSRRHLKCLEEMEQTEDEGEGLLRIMKPARSPNDETRNPNQ